MLLIHISSDDLFQTPLSSPPSEEEEATDSAPLTQPLPPDTLPGSIQSAASLRRRQADPYERYLLRLSDLQVLVGKAGEDWKEATRSGRSSVHLLDKFTLSFQIQRWVHISNIDLCVHIKVRYTDTASVKPPYYV